MPWGGIVQDASGVGGFCGALLGGAARSHLALGEVEDAGAMAVLGHLEEGAAAGLLHVVAVGGDGEDIERNRVIW